MQQYEGCFLARQIKTFSDFLYLPTYWEKNGSMHKYVNFFAVYYISSTMKMFQKDLREIFGTIIGHHNSKTPLNSCKTPSSKWVWSRASACIGFAMRTSWRVKVSKVLCSIFCMNFCGCPHHPKSWCAPVAW